MILPFTNKDTSIECSLEEKEMIRNYVNSHTENIRNQRYWDQLDSLLREKFTPEMLANIYLSYYEEKLKTNKAKLIYAPFSFKSDPDSNIKHSITPVPAKKDIILLTQIPNNKLKIKIDHIITEIKEEAKSSVDPDHLKAEEFGKILKSFHKLAQECRKLSSSYISDKEIVETLAKYDGETKLTLEHYYKLNKSSV